MVTKVKPSPFANGNYTSSNEAKEDLLLQASKAIHDSLKDTLTKEVQGLETSLTLRLAKSLEVTQQQVVEDRFSNIEGQIRDDTVEALRREVITIVQEVVGTAVAGVREELHTTLEQVSQAMRSELEQVGNALSSSVLEMKSQVRQLKEVYELGMAQVKELLIALPTPQVHVTVPEGAISINQMPSVVNLPEGSINVEVKQLPSQVSVTVPENAIEFKQLPSIVHLPEGCINVEVKQMPSIVNVGDKAFDIKLQQDAPHVTINTPKAKRMKKTIGYDQYNRPETIIEEEDTE